MGVLQMSNIIKIKEVSNRTGLQRSAIYKRIQEGLFPHPIKIGKRASGWIDAEISEWIAGRIADRDEKLAG